MRLRFSLRTLLFLVLLVAFCCWYFLVPSRTDRLRTWLAANTESISTFYELDFAFDEVLDRETFFQYWIDDYVEVGYEFISVAGDGSGGRYAVWYRPNQKGPPPLVFLGSEGEQEVIVRSAWDFPQYLAHMGSDYVDYVGDHPDWIRWSAEGKAGRAKYREALLKRFGKIRPLEEVDLDCDDLQQELVQWLDRCREGE